MRDFEDFDVITTQTCDSCGQRRPGVLLHCRGTPVMFLCNHQICGGVGPFERVAKRDIDLWLEEVPFSDSDFAFAVDFDWKVAS